MSELDSGATNSVAEISVAPSGETPASTPASVDTTASQPSEQPDATGEQPEKPKATQDRQTSRAFASLRRTNTELQRTIGRLEERLSAVAPASQPKSGPPKQSDYNTFDEFNAAVIAHAVETAVGKVKAENGSRDQQNATRNSGQSFWREAAKEAKEKGISGFDEAAKAISSEEVATSPFMSHYLIEKSKNRAAMVVWLSENPDEAERIAAQGPVEAGAEMAWIDANLGKSAPVSKAPAPVPQPTGGGTAPQTIARMSYEDLKKQVAKWGRS